MNEYELVLNKIAQNLIDKNDGVLWFVSHNTEDQLKILRSLCLCLSQSHPELDVVDRGIIDSGLKETFTPCVIIKKFPMKIALKKMLDLPVPEWKKIFILLIAIFRISDSDRRNNQCRNGCDHWWHNLDAH